MKNKRMTQIILTFATLVVTFFAGLNLYTYLGKPTDISRTAPVVNVNTVVIPVEGMTCFACEVAVTSALRKVAGVVKASASVKEKTAKVAYDPDKININQLIEAINKTGFKARLPGGE